jgi:hypothetical protein
MRLIENRRYSRGGALTAGAWRAAQSIAARALRAFVSAWNQAFPMPPLPTDPDDPAPIAKAAALRDPALLAEHLDAVSEEKAG